LTFFEQYQYGSLALTTSVSKHTVPLVDNSDAEECLSIAAVLHLGLNNFRSCPRDHLEFLASWQKVAAALIRSLPFSILNITKKNTKKTKVMSINKTETTKLLIKIMRFGASERIQIFGQFNHRG